MSKYTEFYFDEPGSFKTSYSPNYEEIQVLKKRIDETRNNIVHPTKTKEYKELVKAYEDAETESINNVRDNYLNNDMYSNTSSALGSLLKASQRARKTKNNAIYGYLKSVNDARTNELESLRARLHSLYDAKNS